MEQEAARAQTRLSAAAQEAAVADARGLCGERLVAYALGAGSGEDRSRLDVRATAEWPGSQ
jgi:hypothetical protein